MTAERFWTAAWDEGIADVDPARWDTTLVDAVRPAFERYGDRLCVSYLGVEVTFGEIDRYANRLAHRLREAGLGPGDVVGINLPNIPEYVIAWLGVLRAGCVVSGVSPLLSPAELVHQLTDANAKGLVTLDAVFAARLVGIASQLPELKLVVTASVGGFLPPFKRFLGKLLGKIPKGKVTPLPGKTVVPIEAVIKSNRYPDTAPEVDLSPDDLAYLQYTGGTTGPPKGAMLSHRNAVADLVIVQHWLGWEEGTSLALSGFPFFHIAGLFFCENCVFLGWGQVLVPNPRDTDYICNMIAQYRPQVLVNVSSLFQILMQNPRFKDLDHSRMDVCISAAAPFPEESQRELEAVVGPGKMLEVYGMSETSPLTVMNPYRGPKKLGAIGLPLPNTEIRLVDHASGQVVERGEPGEICVRGPMVMRGYHGQPEETANTIDADGFLHTGDVAIQDEDGYLRIVDRTKDMIIVGGFKVFSKKVEEALTAHPAVETIALISQPHPDRPGSELVKACVVRTPEYADRDEAEVRAAIIEFAREILSPYEVPKTLVFRDELPLTPIGKVDKKLLRTEEG